MNPLDEYVGIIAQYIAKYGENAGWPPILINKVFLQVMIELDLIVSFSIGNHPVISETQKILHEDYISGIISSNPEEIFSNVKLKSKNNLSDYENYLNCLSILFKEKNYPYIKNTNYFKSKIKEIGKDANYNRIKNIEKKVDSKVFSRIDNCRNLDYIDPKIESKLKFIQRIDNLDDLCNIVTKLRNSNTLGGDRALLDREEYILQKIREGCKDKETSKLIKITNPYNSSLKIGKIDYVINFRYLEFIREKNGQNYEPILITKGNENFIVAAGKINKNQVAPSWVELYFFNMTGKSEDEISNLIYKLEQFMVLLYADKFFINDGWKGQIIQEVNNFKRKLIADNENENETSNQFGKYGGNVCMASLCVDKDTINFPLSEIGVKDYLNNVYIQLLKALSDLKIHSIIQESEDIKILNLELEKIKNENIIYKLRFLEERLFNIYNEKLGIVEVVGPNIKRPLYLFNVLNDNKINCEGFVALSLFIIFNNPKIFPLEELKIKISYAPFDLLQEILSNSREKMYVNDDHMFIILEFKKEKFLFDPTNILKNHKLKMIQSINDDLYIQIKNINIGRE